MATITQIDELITAEAFFTELTKAITPYPSKLMKIATSEKAIANLSDLLISNIQDNTTSLKFSRYSWILNRKQSPFTTWTDLVEYDLTPGQGTLFNFRKDLKISAKYDGDYIVLPVPAYENEMYKFIIRAKNDPMIFAAIKKDWFPDSTQDLLENVFIELQINGVQPR